MALGAKDQRPETTDRRPPAAAAFTLIELLLAIGLSSLLVLLAVTTFRSVVGTMRDIDRLADENRQIRSGFFMVMDEADYWHSHANPAFPYLQRHMSATVADPAVDKRPFRPVRWPKSLDDPRNPNWTEASDPRSWYRNHLRPNVQTGTFVYGAKGAGSNTYVFRPDFPTYGDTSKGNIETRASAATVMLDPGWEAWHLVGDYADIANCEMAGPPGSHEHLAGSRPVQAWHVFGELGMLGCFSYLPPGSPTLIQLSSRNEVPENYVDSDVRMATNYSKGEIPWSLQANTKAVIERELQILEGPRAGNDVQSYPATFAAEFPDHDRLNWALAMPSPMDAGREDAAGLRRFGFLSDFDAMSTDQRCSPLKLGFGDGEGGRGNSYGNVPLSPLGVFLPPVPRQERFRSDVYQWQEFDNFVLDPLAMIDLSRDFTMSQASFSGRRFYQDQQYRLMIEEHQHRTWHVPSRPTNAITGALTAQELRDGGLATAIHRYQYNGNEKARCTITVQDRRGEKALQFRINVISTTWRGARHYWGRQSGSSGVPDGLGGRVMLGDQYE